jgi:hypothetical protein
VGVEEEARERPTDEDRASDDHRLGPGDLYVRLGDQLHHPLRRARDQARAALGEEAGAGRGQAVHVLGWVDRRDHGVLVEPVGERQLDEDSIDVLVPVQALDQVDELPLRCVAPELVMDRAHPDLLARLALVADVDVGGGVVPDQDRREARRAAEIAGELGGLGGDQLADPGGERLAVDDLRRHRRHL